MTLLSFNRWLGLSLLLVSASVVQAQDDRPPNIILIMADDLGAAETGATGSTTIKTPNIDRLFAEGMRFTQGYSGSTVCAPSRCTLLTGLHTGHAQVRGNGEIPNLTGNPGAPGTKEISGWQAPPMPDGWWGGQQPLKAGTETIATALKRKGYATFAAGKWGLGGPMTEGLPTRQGFDGFVGYLCQRNAHNYYPTYLARDEGKVFLDGNNRGLTGKTYATDLMIDAGVEFIQENSEEPFFLYYATPVPHLALQAPEDSLAQYRGKWEETPYTGGKGYLAQAEPRATYAAMVTRLDRNVGRILDAVKEAGVEDETIIIFTSDNGSTFDLGGYDPAFFNGTGGLRGHKCNLYEGGVRVPLAIAWPGHIEAGSSSDVPVANWDFFPTIMGLTSAHANSPVDGIDVSPVLLGTGDAPDREYLYWEYHPGSGLQAVRMGKWKGVRNGINKNPGAKVELYDLEVDPNETTNVAKENSEVASRIREIMHEEHTPSLLDKWNFPQEGPSTHSVIDSPGEVIAMERMELGSKDVFQVNSGVVTGTNQGLVGGQIILRGGQLERQFLVDSQARVERDGVLVLGGGGVPLNRSTVDLGEGGTVMFLAETPEDVRKEHLQKFTVDGKKAVEGKNMLIQKDGEAGSMVMGGTSPLAPPPTIARLDLPGAPGFSEVKREYERRNPGTSIDFMSARKSIPTSKKARVAFVQRGEGEGAVRSQAGETTTSAVRVGDFLAMRPGDIATFDTPVDLVIFTVEEPFAKEIPSIIRADFDPKLSDTPGGCATDPGAYRRLLLTWDPERGPYVHHGLNCHRVRIDDSFTHYHPVDTGWDEFYLVQGAPEGAVLLTSRHTDQLEREDIGGRGSRLNALEATGVLEEHTLHNGSLVLLPRGLTHRGLGGAVVQVIAVPGFKPGNEIPMDRAIKQVNGRFALTGGKALPLHAAGIDRERPEEQK